MIEQVTERPDDGHTMYRRRVTIVAEDDRVLSTLETPAIEPRNYSGEAEAFFVPPDEVLLSTGEEPVLRWHGLDGRARREVRFELPVEPVTREEREAIEAYIEDRIAEAPVSPGEPGAETGTRGEWMTRREHLDFPAMKAFWARVLVSDTGWLWLIRARPEKYGTNEAYDARVVSPDGRYVGDTRTPSVYAPIGLGGDLFLALVSDADTGERVPTVYRLRPAVAGFDFTAR